jgi:two-component system phosphate regulon response regulator PhoB
VTKVLICDDEPLLRQLMRVALLGDYEFEEAGTVEESIERAQSFRPDVALIDVMMPGGSGLEIIRHLKGEPGLQHVRCIVISAFSGEADQREATDAGAAAFVAKPFDPDDLSATVASLLADGP